MENAFEDADDVYAGEPTAKKGRAKRTGLKDITNVSTPNPDGEKVNVTVESMRVDTQAQLEEPAETQPGSGDHGKATSPEKELENYTMQHVLTIPKDADRNTSGKSDRQNDDFDGLSEALSEIIRESHPELDMDDIRLQCTGSDAAAVADANVSRLRLGALKDSDRFLFDESSSCVYLLCLLGSISLYGC